MSDYTLLYYKLIIFKLEVSTSDNGQEMTNNLKGWWMGIRNLSVSSNNTY